MPGEIPSIEAIENNSYEIGYRDGESSVSADIFYWLNEYCGMSDDYEGSWREYTRMLAILAGVIKE